jgi:hypothetical protein
MKKLLWLTAALLMAVQVWAQEQASKIVPKSVAPVAAAPYIPSPVLQARGTEAIIFTENFEGASIPNPGFTTTLPAGWYATDVNGNSGAGGDPPQSFFGRWQVQSGRQPNPSRPGGTKSALYQYDSPPSLRPGDDYLFTPVFAATASTPHRLTFYYHSAFTAGNPFSESFRVVLSTDTTVASIVSVIVPTVSNIQDTGWVQRVVNFNIPSTGNFRIGIHCNSNADQDRLYIDDVSLETVALPLALNPFALQSPPNGTRVVTSPTTPTPVTITWDTSATGARYNWVFRLDTVSAPRLLTIPSATNSLTLRNSQIDTVLAGLGVNPGDSVSGFWTVWAYKGTGAPGPDSLRATTNRAIRFVRQATTLSAFSLVSPPNNTTLVTLRTNPSPVNITWRRSGTGAVTYRWQFAASTTGNFVPTLNLRANNSGLDTALTLRVSQVDSVLAGLGLAQGDSVVGRWRVYAYRTATDSLSSTETNNITFRRGVGFQYRTNVLLNAGYDSLTTGTVIAGVTGDDAFGTVTIPFTFNYAGVPYTSVNVSTNGLANFGTGSSEYINELAATTPPFNLIAGFWDDLEVPSTASVVSGTVGTAPNRQYVIQWNNVPRLGATNRYNFQIRLYETSNVIEICYGSSTNAATAAASIGLKGAVGGSGDFINAPNGSTTLANDNIAAIPARGLRFRFTPGAFAFANTQTEVSNAPREFALSQNYPNPFNPTTNINYALPAVMDVKLEVFNLLGQKVATLVNARQQAGNYTVPFNAANFASGVYFYKIQAGNNLATKKMMLVK